MLFYRYALIYESSLTQAVHTEAVPEPGQDMPQMEAPLPVPPVQMQLSTTVAVLDEVADIGSGWWSDPPPPVPPIQIQVGSIAFAEEIADIGSGWWSDPPPPVPPIQIQVGSIAFAEEIADIGSGWWSDPPPIVLPFPPVYVLDLEQVAEEAVADTSQEMVFSESPGPVPPIQMQLSTIDAVLEEFADIGSGWWSDPPPIVLPFPPVYVLDLEQVTDDSQELVFSESPPAPPPIKLQISTIVMVTEDIASLGGANNDLVIVHFPYTLIYQQNAGPVPDEFPEIDSGWWSDPPPPVPAIQMQESTIATFLDEIGDIGSGWWSDPPPVVLPIVVPDSSIAFAEEVVPPAPPSRIRRLRELGMGILKRQQLG